MSHLVTPVFVDNLWMSKLANHKDQRTSSSP